MSKKQNSTQSPSLWMRLIIPLALVLVWVVAAGVGGPYFGKIEEVSSNDPATFLPESAESTEVRERLLDFQDNDTVPAIIVFESDAQLSSAEVSAIESTREELNSSDLTVAELSPVVRSEDGQAAFIVAPLAGDTEFGEAIPELQALVAESDPGVVNYFTGPAMFSRDLQNAFAGIDGTLLVVALSVVFVILLVVYRSPILPVVTLIGAISALSAAIIAVYYMAEAEIFTLNGQVQGILFILVIGAATDYSLLYIARYREELMRTQSALEASKVAWKASLEPITAAGGTVILGLLCLLASDLGSNQALGPVGGLGIIFSMLVALTFLPSVLLLLGRKAFWPRQPRYESGKKLTDYHSAHPAWSKVAHFVSLYPRRLWLGITAVLLVAALAVPQLRAEGVSQGDLIIGESEARDGQAALDRHFASGAGSPATVLTPADQRLEVIRLLEDDEGVSSVGAIGADGEQIPQGKQAEEIVSTAQQATLQLPPAARAEAQSSLPVFEPKVVDGTVALTATLTDDASSVAARETVQRLRDSIKAEHPDVQIGGLSAIQLDTNNASQRDLAIIIPLILVAITLVLMVLLRSIVAPLLLVLTTVISFASTIGIAALLFNNVWGFAGADPSIILFGFVFLVALGIDYNIFLMTRVREETIKLGVREGTLKALVVTGGVITSAGIVLAATFAALYVIPILFLAQIAFIVSFGVLLDTLIVRSLLVPALTLDVGRPMWWPSKLSKEQKD